MAFLLHKPQYALTVQNTQNPRSNNIAEFFFFKNGNLEIEKQFVSPNNTN